MKRQRNPASEEQEVMGAARRGISLRAVISFLVIVVMLPLVLFLAAGRWDWAAAWAYVAAHWAGTFASRLLAWRVNPDLLVERGRTVDEGMGTRQDRLLVLVAAILGPLLLWIVAGLDERFAWSPDLPPGVQEAAFGVLLAAFAFSTWAFVTNAFFSAVVRIQEDRGQRVITSGPYRLVRHPAYAAGIVVYLATPLLLDSLWALIPAAVTAAVVVARTSLEDRFLHGFLPGYAAYARRTRHRLLPGVW
ncbi:MAG TPA: isoprenylcysteine carboxylmethyltransferase family protein [Anaerolineae bacterium]|nr:isoprenylcysteine carboxylmethyltransferase family protein [Anaerolineae bacterium]